jgi:hypothetical protein
LLSNSFLLLCFIPFFYSCIHMCNLPWFLMHWYS